MQFSIHVREEALTSWPIQTEGPRPQAELLAGALAIELTEGGEGVSRVRCIPAYEAGNPHDDDHIIFHLSPRANMAEYSKVIDRIVDTVFTYIQPDFTGLTDPASA